MHTYASPNHGRIIYVKSGLAPIGSIDLEYILSLAIRSYLELNDYAAQ